MRVLIVEDDVGIARLLRTNLQGEGFAADYVVRGQECVQRVSQSEYSLIILDVRLPDMSGFEVCDALRKNGVETPILMLTGLRTTDDKVRGLDSGADDYLVKPFEVEELMARVRSLLRRRGPTRSPQLVVGDLSLDPSTHEVRCAGRLVELSAREYCLLEFLMRNSGQVVSRQDILRQVWGIDYDPRTNLVDVHIRHLRQKIDHGRRNRLIQTVRGFGYRLAAADSQESPSSGK